MLYKYRQIFRLIHVYLYILMLINLYNYVPFQIKTFVETQITKYVYSKTEIRYTLKRFSKHNRRVLFLFEVNDLRVVLSDYEPFFFLPHQKQIDLRTDRAQKYHRTYQYKMYIMIITLVHDKIQEVHSLYMYSTPPPSLIFLSCIEASICNLVSKELQVHVYVQYMYIRNSTYLYIIMYNVDPYNGPISDLRNRL